MSDIPASVDPKKTTSYRLLMAVVIFLGLLIVIALGVLVVGLVTRFAAHGAAREGTAPGLVLAPGARIVAMDTQPDRLILRVRTEAGDEIDIVDIRDGSLIGRIKEAPRK